MTNKQFKELCDEYQGAKVDAPIEVLIPFIEFCIKQMDEKKYEHFSDNIQH